MVALLVAPCADCHAMTSTRRLTMSTRRLTMSTWRLTMCQRDNKTYVRTTNTRITRTVAKETPCGWLQGHQHLHCASAIFYIIKYKIDNSENYLFTTNLCFCLKTTTFVGNLHCCYILAVPSAKNNLHDHNSISCYPILSCLSYLSYYLFKCIIMTRCIFGVLQ